MREPCLAGFLALATVIPSPARAQGFQIQHSGVSCVVVDKFPRLVARFEPEQSVLEARVHFRPTSGQDWYSVSMRSLRSQGFQAPAGAYWGFLPKPEKSLKGFAYYIEVVGDSFGPFRTPEYRPMVVQGFGACRDGEVAAGVASASVRVATPPGATSLPLVPAGFSEAGVVAAGPLSVLSRAAVATTETTPAPAEPAPAGARGGSAGADARGAADGGGLSSTTAVILAVVGGAAVGAGISASGGGDGAIAGGSETDPPSPPGPSLTGQWAGSFETTWASSCTVATMYTIELIQTGRSLSGEATTKLSFGPASIASCPFFQVLTGTERFTGSVNGASVALAGAAEVISSPDSIDPVSGFSQELMGIVSGDRISGTGNARLTGAGEVAAATVSWELMRQ